MSTQASPVIAALMVKCDSYTTEQLLEIVHRLNLCDSSSEMDVWGAAMGVLQIRLTEAESLALATELEAEFLVEGQAQLDAINAR